jgi:mannose-6-phosphate isomerase-like protein (cupin superfamily)
MIVRNAFSIFRRVGPSGHGGVGSIEHCRVFNAEDFESDWNSVSFDVLPPGCAIGVHEQREEEIYFILEGHGIATVSGEECEVGPGDMVLARRGDTHGIRNHFSQPLKMVAIGVRVQS